MSLPPCHVAVVGADNMEGAMVARLCDQGWTVTVFDIDPARQQRTVRAGGHRAGTPEMAANALAKDGLLIVWVVDATQTRAVLWAPDGAAVAMWSGQAVMLCPTIAPHATELRAAALAARRVTCIDARCRADQRAREMAA